MARLQTVLTSVYCGIFIVIAVVSLVSAWLSFDGKIASEPRVTVDYYLFYIKETVTYENGTSLSKSWSLREWTHQIGNESSSISYGSTIAVLSLAILSLALCIVSEICLWFRGNVKAASVVIYYFSIVLCLSALIVFLAGVNRQYVSFFTGGSILLDFSLGFWIFFADVFIELWGTTALPTYSVKKD